jgi:hypothetical protein
MQFEQGMLTIDTVCGVRSGERQCLRPLNCKYHSVSLKRLVPDRSRPFEELLAEFNAAQQAARASAAAVSSSRSRRPSGGLHGSAASAAPKAAGGLDGTANSHHGGSLGVGMTGGGHLGMGGIGAAGGGGLVGFAREPAVSRPELDVPDDGWKADWLRSVRALAATLGDERVTKRPATSIDAIAPPLHVGQPMRRKRRLTSVPLSLLLNSADSSQPQPHAQLQHTGQHTGAQVPAVARGGRGGGGGARPIPYPPNALAAAAAAAQRPPAELPH